MTEFPGSSDDHAELAEVLRREVLLAGGEAAIDLRQRLCAVVDCDRRAICSHIGIPLCGQCMKRLEDGLCKPVRCGKRKG